MELAVSDWNVLLFMEIQGAVRQMEMTRLKQDDHLLVWFYIKLVPSGYVQVLDFINLTFFFFFF